MSGWLGTINYGVITANKIDSFLREKFKPSSQKTSLQSISTA